MKYCQKCGTKLRDKSKVCWECGTSVEPTINKPQDTVSVGHTAHEKIDGLSDELDRVTKNLENTRSKLEKLKKNQSKKIAGLAGAAIGAFAIAVSVGISQYNGMVVEYNALWRDAENVKTQLASTKDQLNSLNTNLHEAASVKTQLVSAKNQLNTANSQLRILTEKYPIIIDKIEVGNHGEGSWINSPGTTLYAWSMRYFMPRITYTSFLPGSRTLTFSIKIFDPDGVIRRNPDNSPPGFTYRITETIYSGSGSVDLSGWGNASSSSYRPGNWRIEVWYQDVCLGTTTVRLQ